ncbi:MAG: DNA repair protein RecN [Planctomycetes bacterium]|nr:DNA repair protein RecN [Planctomycetota bacterium]
MLASLHVRDLALLATAELRFEAGLNVLSGETGGGKSLVVAALKLLRGERASAGLIRHGADELRVDGEFLLGEGARSAAVAELLTEVCGRPPEEGVVVVSRSVDRSGRSRVRIDGRPATLQDLRALCGHLIEIHGQGETRALMRPEIQAETLDAVAGSTELRQRFADALAAARAAAARLEEAGGHERERLERIAFLRYQVHEMQAVGLTEGELADVEAEHQVLANLDRMRAWLADALDALSEGDGPALDALGRAARALDPAAEIDRELAPAAELVADARAAVADAARIVQSRLSGLDLDPARLGDIEERLATLRRALARFGPTERDFLATLQRNAAELAELEDEASEPAALQEAVDKRLAELEAAARKLVRARRKGAGGLVAAIEAELTDLGMPHTRFRIAMDDDVPAGRALLDAATAHGPGPLDFEVRINPGEPFRSMRETASGGEMARIVLAVKKCLADRDRVPFVVFDEIDAEIGGRLGLQVGRKLKDVAAHHQVLIVTHLPQVAAFADVHLKVAKSVRGERTWASVERLDDEAAERELAAMAAGESADREALEEARRLRVRAREAR